jgi:hypothetical protein
MGLRPDRVVKISSNFVPGSPQIENCQPNTGAPPFARGGVESSNLSLSALKMTPNRCHFPFS